MSKIPENYIIKLYAGVLGKIIGVRHGAPIEGWTYDRIKEIYGEITGYLVDYRQFAADDDTNGPIFFLRAFEDYNCTSDITAEQIGETVLNYVPYEHGFFWWGGYGVSTEHTAYLNLRSGIKAPESGSIRQNGKSIAEQIGGQIFIDGWGLVVPGVPKLAAQYAKKAASVMHGGNGIYGGMFIAACISKAFVEKNTEKIIEGGLSVIPKSCEYTKMARDVINFHKSHYENWRECFDFIRQNYGYNRYPGNCHIIPNSAIIILSLLYGNGNFAKSINICNMCGWDTDCNAGNVGTIMGVANGLEGIKYDKWIRPINDFLACSSVMGSLNILDVPSFILYIAKYAYKIADEEYPEEWKRIFEAKGLQFHFELPGSTHGFRLDIDMIDNLNYKLVNTKEFAHSGKRSLKLMVEHFKSGKELRVFYKTYYRPEDFFDSRYDPSFSPILYPGYNMKGYIFVPAETDYNVSAYLYVKDGNSGTYIQSSKYNLQSNKWTELSFKIPYLEGVCLEEAGIKIIPQCQKVNNMNITIYLDDFNFSGEPNYMIDFTKEHIEQWNCVHKEVSQFSYLKGIWSIEEGQLSGSCSDFAEAYTGGVYWENYCLECTLIPKKGKYHRLNFRVQGAIRSYSVGLAPGNKIVLYKNKNGYRILAQVQFPWKLNNAYNLKIEIRENHIEVASRGIKLLEYIDDDRPYLRGAVGVSVQNGSHCHYENMKISPIYK